MAAAAKFDPYTGAPYQTYVQEGEQTGESAKPHGKKKLTKHTGNPKKIGK